MRAVAVNGLTGRAEAVSAIVGDGRSNDLSEWKRDYAIPVAHYLGAEPAEVSDLFYLDEILGAVEKIGKLVGACS